VLIETDSGGTTTATYTNASGVISQKRGSTTSWYNFEAIGTTRQLTDSSQVVSDTYSFDAWGNGLSSSGSTTNALRYVGRENYYTDAQSGLMMLGVRYYDATNAKFLSSDPEQDDTNWYTYVQDNPARQSDPTGRAAGRNWTCKDLEMAYRYNQKKCDDGKIEGVTDCFPSLRGEVSSRLCPKSPEFGRLGTCLETCTAKHEATHISQIEAPCEGLGKCMAKQKGNEKGEDQCCSVYASWSAKYQQAQECEAWRAGADCANGIPYPTDHTSIPCNRCPRVVITALERRRDQECTGYTGPPRINNPFDNMGNPIPTIR